jgi:hypothetical protein
VFLHDENERFGHRKLVQVIEVLKNSQLNLVSVAMKRYLSVEHSHRIYFDATILF